MSDQRDRHVRRLGPAVEAADRLLVPTSITYGLMDRAVGLPPGGAQQGRLFAVVVRGRGVPGTSIERGDRLIVAPETELASGGLLVCRRMSALEVCAARVDAFGKPSLTSPDPELLPWPSVFAPVLGSVVAALRRVGRELLVASPPRYRFERSVPPELSWRLSPTQLEQLRAGLWETRSSRKSSTPSDKQS